MVGYLGDNDGKNGFGFKELGIWEASIGMYYMRTTVNSRVIKGANGKASSCLCFLATNGRIRLCAYTN